jgi:hypothetical protein
MLEYIVRRVKEVPALEGDWDDPVWDHADILAIDNFHAEGSEHQPEAHARMLYDDEGLHLIFHVRDRYVVWRHSNFQDPVCRDSCAEFFVQPAQSKGYFNFEMNCGGTLLTSFIEDHRRTPDGFEKYEMLPADCDALVERCSECIVPLGVEHTDPVDWVVQYRVPFRVFEGYLGPLGPISGQTWRGNFYKCADDSSHPHWGAWSPIGDELNFHQPDKFALLRFE